LQNTNDRLVVRTIDNSPFAWIKIINNRLNKYNTELICGVTVCSSCDFPRLIQPVLPVELLHGHGMPLPRVFVPKYMFPSWLGSTGYYSQ
jgi:hypothetical protein